MERHGTWEKLCHWMEILRSRRKEPTLLAGLGFIFAASAFIFIASIFMSPFLSPSLMNPSLIKHCTNTCAGECNIFEGEWVRVDSRQPYYPLGSCPYIERSPYDCYKNGRPDDGYLEWQWQWQSHPSNKGCNDNIPSILNATDFLERLRGKKVAFSGDSLNRNMFESLACILWNAAPDKSKVSWLHGNVEHDVRGDMAVRYEDYNCTVGFVWSPFLVHETNPKNRRTQQGILNQVPETMRLDLIDPRASTFYRDADVVVFDSWHWWVGNKLHNGKDYFQEGNSLHLQLEISKAYKKALTTWRRWIDKNIDSNKTQVAFAEYSETHYEGGQWNTHGKCNKETEPITSNATYRCRDPSRTKVLHDTLRRMKTHVLHLNISKLTYYRADGHPSIYSKNLTAQERIASKDPQDCVHWCLPGVPDTWNELLYISLLRAGKGSFSSLK